MKVSDPIPTRSKKGSGIMTKGFAGHNAENLFHNKSLDLSIQKKICHLLKCGRKYAEGIDLLYTVRT